MAIKDKENYWGAWVFLTGVILACIIGLATTLIPIPWLIKYSTQIYGVLILLGFLVGFTIKIEGRNEYHTFLLTSAILVIVSKFGMDSVKGSLIGIGVGSAVSAIFGALLALFVPATIIVALKSVFSMTKV